MFTGIVTAQGRISRIERKAHDLSLVIDAGNLSMADVALGDSIAVNGVCLTVTQLATQGFCADVSIETMNNTQIASWQSGTAVNLEKALTLATPLGGHLVSGHVDGVASIESISADGRSSRYELSFPTELARYIAPKGSITIDGVSLTVTSIDADRFCLNVVPHTLGHTIFPGYKQGSRVHIEVDLMARYAERLLGFGGQPEHSESKRSISKTFLHEYGFTGLRSK